MKMMKLFTVAVVFLATLAATPSFAQKQKFGYVNSTELLQLMPERSDAEAQLKVEAQNLEKQLQEMTKEYQAKVADYQQNEAGMSKVIKETKIQEISGLEDRIQKFQGSAQQELQQTESKLLQPLLDKAQKAIDKVAEENGYTYVFDSSTGTLLHAPDGDNILPLVKKELGIE